MFKKIIYRSKAGPNVILSSSFYITRIYVNVSRFINSIYPFFSASLHEKYLQRITCQNVSVIIDPDCKVRRHSYEGCRL